MYWNVNGGEFVPGLFGSKQQRRLQLSKCCCPHKRRARLVAVPPPHPLPLSRSCARVLRCMNALHSCMHSLLLLCACACHLSSLCSKLKSGGSRTNACLTLCPIKFNWFFVRVSSRWIEFERTLVTFRCRTRARVESMLKVLTVW